MNHRSNYLYNKPKLDDDHPQTIIVIHFFLQKIKLNFVVLLVYACGKAAETGCAVIRKK